MVLGKAVFDAHGGRLGDVVDVGIHDWRRVKFLLVEDGDAAERITRLSVDLIDTVGSRGVILKRPSS